MYQNSIVIPTYNKYEETLQPCLESIIKYTDLKNTEVIIVANGCTDGTMEYMRNICNENTSIKCYWFKEALGYTKATNEGIKKASGEYIILLNNDTILLNQEKDSWIKILKKPFEDDSMGITGPMKTFSDSVQRSFLIFFCVMIHKKVFDKIGLLDEIFSPGYYEDVDFCLKAEDSGFIIKQVPEESSKYYADKRMMGNFPIFHKGNVTFQNWPDGDKLLEHNSKILNERYMPTLFLEKALKCDGFMSEKELEWLTLQAKKNKIIVEVGSWHGRSSRAIADNLLPDGILYCIDTWNGSEAEKDTHHASAKLNEGDHAFIEFTNNLFDHIQTGKVIPLRMSSYNASQLFNKNSIEPDLVFIDAGHTYQEVHDDILNWFPIKNGAIICGHDYYCETNTWPEVKKAVDEILLAELIPNTSLWSFKVEIVTNHQLPKVISKRRKVFDCFLFFNELDILEIRFNELYDVVDRFIITEATKTHGGKNKPLNFHNNLKRFEKFLNKVTYLVVDTYPALDSWSIERHQRNSLTRGLCDCEDGDVIIMSDVDEIPKVEVIKNYDTSKGLCCISQNLYYYYLNYQANEIWNWARILPYSKMKTMTPCEVRYTVNYDVANQLIYNGGWHFSYIGGVDKVIEKIHASAHQEYNTPEFTNKKQIEWLVKNGQDIFKRPGHSYKVVHIGPDFPNFILKNKQEFLKKGLINEDNGWDPYQK